MILSNGPSASDEFIAACRETLGAQRFGKLVLAKRRSASTASALGEADAETLDLKRVTARLIRLRDEPTLSLVFTHATRDITRNLDVEAGLARIEELLLATFSHAHLATSDETLEWRISRKGRQTLRRSRSDPHEAVARTEATAGMADGDGTSFCGMALNGAVALNDVGDRAADGALEHDHAKHRFVDVRAPWLTALGVTDAQHRVVPAMARKWRQINKFVEIVDHALTTSGLVTRDTEPVRIADFGCGKGYLTFAVHAHLSQTHGLAVETTGVELRVDLVQAGNRISKAAGLSGLHFEAGDLRTHEPASLDVMIALHACDTATDHAIHLGLLAGARVIMCSPCCHKELRPQMAKPAALDGLLRHGVHLGQQAEMVTDSLRALLLEAEGYDAKVFEFVALEHTSKNKMILAVKRDDVESPKARASAATARDEIARIKAFYAIGEQRLELLRRDAAATSHG